MTTATESWQHRNIITNGIRMHYVTQGTGPLVLLLHGFPEFWYSWRLQIPFLAEHGYTAVAPDLRGYNDSEKPHQGYDVPTLLLDIVGLIEGLGQEKAIIVGHDWGGALAWAFAMKYPHMTERLVVMNAPHPRAFTREMRTLKQLRKSWYIFAFQIPWLPEYMLGRNSAKQIGKLFYDTAVQKAAFPPEVQRRYQEAMSKPGALTSAINYYRATFRNPFFQSRATIFQSRATISVPTLLIWGEQDVALGINLTQNLEPWVPNLHIERLPDSGHWVQQEKAERVNEIMLKFLTTGIAGGQV